MIKNDNVVEQKSFQLLETAINMMQVISILSR